MHFLGREIFVTPRPALAVVAGLAIAAAPAIIVAAPASALTVTRVLVDVDFTSASMSGSTITNTAADKTDDLTVSGSPTGLGTASGLTFANTTTGSTDQYLIGNLGNTTLMSEIVVEFDGKFPDTGCEAQPNGSMIFGLGSAGLFIPYNIYRHSDFVGYNTFSSDMYGITIPDTTSYHRYKFVMVPSPAAQSLQEIWVDGVKQTLSQKTTSVATSPCSLIAGSETLARRIFTGGDYSYTDGSFMLMSHPLAANNWGTTGSLKNIKITTSNTYVEPSAPSIGSVTAGDGQLSVAFTAPSSNGGRDITDYRYSTDNGATWVSAGSTTSPIVITGLTNGTNYGVKLLAVNSVGDGSASDAVAARPTDGSATPDAPVIDDVITGDGTLSVFFTPPANNGGSAITDYEYSTDNGATWVSAGSTSSPIVITGLTNGTNYDLQIRAVNSGGVGTASTSTSATPAKNDDGIRSLAATGADIGWAALGSLAAIAGGTLLFATRRRRQNI